MTIQNTYCIILWTRFYFNWVHYTHSVVICLFTKHKSSQEFRLEIYLLLLYYFCVFWLNTYFSPKHEHNFLRQLTRLLQCLLRSLVKRTRISFTFHFIVFFYDCNLSLLWHFYKDFQQDQKKNSGKLNLLAKKLWAFSFIFILFFSEYYNDKQNDFKCNFIFFSFPFFRSFLIKNFQNSNKFFKCKNILGSEKKGFDVGTEFEYFYCSIRKPCSCEDNYFKTTNKDK